MVYMLFDNPADKQNMAFLSGYETAKIRQIYPPQKCNSTKEMLAACKDMAKNGCRIGGEQSGHIIFSKYASTGDGILTSLKMMEVMLAKKKPMSELAAPLKIYPQVLENVRVTDKKAAQNDPAVQEVRVMVEAPDHDTCQKYVDEVVNVICEKGYKV